MTVVAAEQPGGPGTRADSGLGVRRGGVPARLARRRRPRRAGRSRGRRRARVGGRPAAPSRGRRRRSRHRGGHPLADPRAARGPGRARRRDAGRGRRDVPGRLPQPARRSRTSSASPRARGSARRSRSRTCPRACADSARSRSPRSSAGSIAVMLTYAVGRSARRERDAATLVLAGVTVTAFFTAWQTFVQQQNSETLQQVYSWILGNIPSTGWSDVVLILPYVAVALVVILALRRVVDVLNLGDDEAASLGVDVRRVRLALVVAATLGTAAAVAVTGLIGFVGIIVPHTIRLLTGSRLPRAAAAVGHRRRRVPRPRRRRRAHGALARGDPARRRHRVLRRAVLRARPAHDPGRLAVSAIELRERHGRARRPPGRRPGRRVVVEQGEWVALIGPNGAGKTTLLRAIARLVPFAGAIALDGRSSAGAGADGARAARRGRPAGAVDAAVDDRRRVRPPRADAASRPARRRRARATATPRLGRSHGSISSRSASGRLGRSERRREAAGRRRARARAGGVDRPPRRADCGARHRAPAAGARPARRASRRSRG